MALGFDSTSWTDFVGAWFAWMLTFIDLDGGREDLELPTGQGTLSALKTREGRGGKRQVGRRWKFFINKKTKKIGLMGIH